MQSKHDLGFTDIAQYHCLRWAELPDLALYMDQVLTILEKQLCLIACGPEDKNLTSTMINNYVKHKVIPAPVKKKYEKEHLANLTMVCIAKQVLSLSEIQAMMEKLRAAENIETLYDRFCCILEKKLRQTFGNQVMLEESKEETPNMLEALAGAFANKLYLQMLLMEQTTEKGKKAE
ncbi:MAG: DUF1836 domain-containing protein [Clostridiales bacterium]|nr:DUF1836 domain-containing protein [Clostridiales bacterium]